MASEIKCKVSNCDYWNDMKCFAKEVEVNMQAEDAKNCSADTTYCETFKTSKC